MKNLTLLLLLCFLGSLSALASPMPTGVWVQAPNGVFPDPGAGPITNWGTEEECGAECVNVQQADGSIVDFTVGKIQGKQVVLDIAKKNAKAIAKAQADADAQAAADALKTTIKGIDNVTTLAQAKAVLKALIVKLRADQ